MILMMACLLIMNGECNAIAAEGYGYRFKLLRGSGSIQTTENLEKERDFEYPGSNKEILRQVQKKWRIYYDCLEKNLYRKKKPEIIRLLEGQFTELKCEVCPKPFTDYRDVEWKYKPLSSHVNITEPEHLDLTLEMRFTPTKTLKIYNAIEGFSGLYVCYQGKNPISLYILEVSSNDTIQKVNLSIYQDKKDIYFKGIDFEIYYKWSKWTECSLCGHVGRKFKYGSCLVSVKKSQHEKLFQTEMEMYRKRRDSKTTNLSKKLTETTTQSVYKIEESRKYESFESEPPPSINFLHRQALEIVNRFETGIPCASQLLPEMLREWTKDYPAVKAVVKHCWDQCLETEIFVVIDQCGRMIEKANNSAGIYSTFQDLPMLAPETERISVEGEFGKDITLLCPGTLLTTAPITWKINKKTIFPEKIANQSNGRFTIDLVNRIHIKKLRSKDGRIYSCWQRDKLAGTVHLNVEKKFKINLNHHAVLVGIMLLVGIFLFIIIKLA